MTPWNISGIRHTKGLVCKHRPVDWFVFIHHIDIDGIKIRSDIEGGASNRSYNYRVSVLILLQLHVHAYIISGRYDQGSSGDGYAWSLFCGTKNACVNHNSACSFRLVQPQLRYSGSRWTDKRVGHGEHWCACCQSSRVSPYRQFRRIDSDLDIVQYYQRA